MVFFCYYQLESIIHNSGLANSELFRWDLKNAKRHKFIDVISVSTSDCFLLIENFTLGVLLSPGKLFLRLSFLRRSLKLLAEEERA